MDWRWVGVAVGLLTLLVVASAGVTGGSPTEGRTVCLGCVPDHEDNVTVEDSVTHVYLGTEGDARVVARTELSGQGIEGLRDDETLEAYQEGLVRRHENRVAYGLEPHQRTDYEVRMDGDTFVVTYRYVNFTEHRDGGISFSDGYVWPRQWGFEDDRPTDVETDRLVVHPPNGTSALVVPPGATKEGRALVWNDGLSGRTYLAFGAEHQTLRAQALVALDVLGWAGPVAARSAGLPMVVLTGLAVAFARSYSRQRGTDPGKRLPDHFSTVCLGTLSVLFAFTLFGQLTIRTVHLSAVPEFVGGLFEFVPLVPYVAGVTHFAVLGAFALGALLVGGYLHRRDATDDWNRDGDPLFWVTVAAPLVAVPFRLVAGSGYWSFDTVAPVLWARTPWGNVWGVATILSFAVISLVVAGYLLFVLTGPTRRVHTDDPLFRAVVGALVLATAYGVVDAARLVAVEGEPAVEAIQGVAILLTSSLGLALVYPVRSWTSGDADGDSPQETADHGRPDSDRSPTGGEADDTAGRPVTHNGGVDAFDATTLTGSVPVVAAVVLTAAVVTLLLALDYQTSYAGPAGLLCLLGLVLAFPVLALLVDNPAWRHRRTAVVAAVPALAWSYQFSLLVVNGTRPYGPQPVVTPWGVVVPVVAVLGFYAVYRWL